MNLSYLSKEAIKTLKTEIQKGIDSLNAGKGVEMTDGLFEKIKKRGKKRLVSVNIPKAETLKAFEEAKDSKNLTSYDNADEAMSDMWK